MHATFLLTILTLALSATARPARRFRLRQANSGGKEAADLNAKFAAAKAGDKCAAGETSCVGDQLGQCVSGAVLATACAPGTVCRALPLVNAAGTTVTCTTQADADARIADAGGAGGAAAPPPPPPAADPPAAGGGAAPPPPPAAGGDAQTSLTLDPAVIAKGFAQDGQDPPVKGQSASITSTNNFINFCVGQTITDGKQVKEGSCNPCPIGKIPSVDKMPSSKFIFPPNNDKSLKVGVPFTFKMKITNIKTGVFTNAAKTYFAAPQQLDESGIIIGHTHIVAQLMKGDVNADDLLSPLDFEFFQGVNAPDENGVASALADEGLKKPGSYRACSINSSSNHQPVIVPVAQHGSLDDCIYFTVTA